MEKFRIPWACPLRKVRNDNLGVTPELLPRRDDFGGLLRPDLAVVSLCCHGVWIWPSQVQLEVVVCSRECVDGFMMATIEIGGLVVIACRSASWVARKRLMVPRWFRGITWCLVVWVSTTYQKNAKKVIGLNKKRNKNVKMNRTKGRDSRRKWRTNKNDQFDGQPVRWRAKISGGAAWESLN